MINAYIWKWSEYVFSAGYLASIYFLEACSGSMELYIQKIVQIISALPGEKDLKMKVSTEKYTIFQIQHKHKTWFLKHPQLTLDQQRIPLIQKKAIKYLETILNL